MSDNLKDILSHLNTGIDQETLLLYLQDKLPDHRKQEVERALADNEFAADAMDGLQEFDDKKHIRHVVEMLNHDLKKKVEKKIQRRQKMKLKDQPWLYAVVFIFIILIVLCYMIIVRMAKN
jgi:hypothetical protein